MNIVNNKLTHFIAGVLIGAGNTELMNSISEYKGKIRVIEGDLVSNYKEFYD